MKILYADRFMGEFNWELMCWIPHLRYLADKYYYIVTTCDPTVQFFYDFVDKFYFKPRPKTVVEWRGGKERIEFDGFPRDRHLMKWFRKVNRKNLDIVYPTEKICLNRKKMKFIEHGKHREEFEYDLVFHARNARGLTYKAFPKKFQNWPLENWGELVDRLPKMRICCIGKNAYYVPGTDDRRSLSMSDLCDLMRSSTLMLSPASGHAHLSNLCGLPLLMWTTDVRQPILKRTNMIKFNSLWKPFEVPIKIIDDHKWKPPVNTVLTKTLNFMEKAHEYRRNSKNGR